MPLIAYGDEERNLRPATLRTIEQANAIIDVYQAQGFTLTLRQLYYQFVSRDLLPNTIQHYKRLGDAINSGRLAGLIDWDAIEDRTRSAEGTFHWDDPRSAVRDLARAYDIDKWADQDTRVEVWIEKEALAGVFEGVCKELDVAYLSCRGYTSQSEMWRGARRLQDHMNDLDQDIVILHFGDHDPSGIDMTRDIEDRLRMFLEDDRDRLTVRRVALNRDQIRQYRPPPNPAKMTDSRFGGYAALHGNQSWELDALEPTVLADLVRRNVEEFRDGDKWDGLVAEQDRQRATLTGIAERYQAVEAFLAKPQRKRGS